jgi:hypothetical protein
MPDDSWWSSFGPSFEPVAPTPVPEPEPVIFVDAATGEEMTEDQVRCRMFVIGKKLNMTFEAVHAVVVLDALLWSDTYLNVMQVERVR